MVHYEYSASGSVRSQLLQHHTSSNQSSKKQRVHARMQSELRQTNADTTTNLPALTHTHTLVVCVFLNTAMLGFDLRCNLY